MDGAGPGRGHIDFYLQIQKLNEAGEEDEAARLSSFKELPSAESSAIFLKCPEGTEGRSEERFNFRRSEHFRHGVSCNDCHSSHAPKRTESRARAGRPTYQGLILMN